MKKVALLLLLPFISIAETVSNSESSSYSSGANINNQTVINESSSYRIEDVRCPVTTIGLVGGFNNVNGGSDVNQANVGIGVNIPIFTGKCEKAATLKLKKIQFDLNDRERILKMKEQAHKIKIIDACEKLKLVMSECYEIFN